MFSSNKSFKEIIKFLLIADANSYKIYVSDEGKVDEAIDIGEYNDIIMVMI